MASDHAEERRSWCASVTSACAEWVSDMGGCLEAGGEIECSAAVGMIEVSFLSAFQEMIWSSVEVCHITARGQRCRFRPLDQRLATHPFDRQAAWRLDGSMPVGDDNNECEGWGFGNLVDAIVATTIDEWVLGGLAVTTECYAEKGTSGVSAALPAKEGFLLKRVWRRSDLSIFRV
ncbi:hypothetical protein BESB_018710 [Besnoitia besnoiti]|uniref:Uncharacterized protein n=1 Tax=Besnoitia besnoiti TaxID=94643 RepID=A0A2A9MA46_BESBE|nr:hypothetical protein BESB_018710 [Besnoitia besnoiti]PFH32553.1 hypothetical protein BESB_018710 [Besnoitia besnoiti]